MISPSVMLIEMAMDSMKKREQWLIESETSEFNSLGPTRKQQIVEAAGGDPMLAGYLLGLETARMYLAGNPDAVQAGVEL